MSAVGKIIAGAALIVAGIVLTPIIGPIAGSQLIAIGVSLVLQGVIGVIRGSQSTKNEISQVNVRIGEPIRWLHAGTAKAGGAVLFAEFDNAGNLWYLVVHSDSPLNGTPQYLLDNIPVTVNSSGQVLSKEFRLQGKDLDPVEVDGQGDAYVQIWTTTYTESNPTPPAITALRNAFPSKWTVDHKLVGTTYSVVKMRALKIEDRFKLYKYRGAIGLGEPGISIIGDWANCYDPRNPAHVLGDRTTYSFSKNAELIWAWWRTQRYGRNKSESEINWDEVSTQADVCDEDVVGIVGTQKRYECGVAIPEDRTRTEGEQDILMTSDAQLVFDDDGKCWARVGKYYLPELALYRNRDIVAMQSIEAQNGESETQGVIVRYTDPDSGYVTQPAAAWYNPFYYVPGQANNFLTVEILGISNHNQAMRIAKAIGLRSQPEHRIAPTVGLRGLRARQERIISIQYDNTFSGEYEISTQVDVDQVGFTCNFAASPVGPDNWDLLPGEERDKNAAIQAAVIALPTPATAVSVAYTNGRIEAAFTPDIRDDVSYQFQTILASDLASGAWRPMTVIDVDGVAYSEPVTLSGDYLVRHRAISGSGRVSAWSSNINVTGQSVITDTVSQAIFNSWIVEVVDGTSVITIDETGELVISNHTRRYSDGIGDVSVTGATIDTGLSAGDVRSIAYDDQSRTGDTVTYTLYASDNDAHVSSTNKYRHYVGFFQVPGIGEPPNNGGGGGIPGGRDDNLQQF